MAQLTMTIAEGTCNGEETQFRQWMNDNYPDIETVIENTMDGGLYDEDGNRVENENYWEKYCSQQWLFPYEKRHFKN